MSEKYEFKVIDGGDLKGYVYMNPEDMSALGLTTLSVIIFEDAIGNIGAGQVRKNDNVELGTILVDKFILEGSHIKHGDVVTIRKYDKEIVGIERVEFVLEPLSPELTGEELKALAEEHIASLKSILDNRIVFPGMEVYWSDVGIVVHIVPIKPKLKGDELGLLSWEAIEYVFGIKGIAERFNAILLIDTSGSMKREDLIVRNIATVIENLKDYARNDPLFQAFLSQFKEGKNVSRISGAALAAQLYLHRKIERGFGEKVAVVTFSKDAKELVFRPHDSNTLVPWVSCKGEGAEIGIKVVSRFIIERCQKASGLTNMGAALEKAAQIIPTFPPNQNGKRFPVMILMLTDGIPTTGRNPIDVVNEHFAYSKDIVIYTLGIGQADEIDEDLLKEIANLGHGEFSHCDDLGELMDWFDKLAQRFTRVLSTS